MTIDAHVHVFEGQAGGDAGITATVEELLTAMDATSVDGAVLVQFQGAAHDDHGYLLRCLEGHPDRFRGIGLVPQELWAAPADHMDWLGEAQGIIGFRLFELGGPADPLARVDIEQIGAFPVWRHAAERDYVIWLYPRGADIHLVPHLAQAFPQVRVVFNHLLVCPGRGTFSSDELGRPRIETPLPPVSSHPLMGMRAFENCYVKLSGQYAFSKQEYPYEDTRSWHMRLLEAFGADRLMWGTDFPFVARKPGYPESVALLDRLMGELPPAERAAIMGGTAQDALRFRDVTEGSAKLAWFN